ncbi:MULTISPECIES: MFS transporter [Bacteria]|uniref:MFS transporter n=1 Tax=Bacteria TaxID=2 RepID=UPI003C7CBD54
MAPSAAVRRAAVAVLACAAQFLVVLDVSLVTVAIPTIAAELRLPDLQSSWVVSGYTVAFAALLLLGGRICDLLGPRRAFLIASGLFVVATAGGALSTDGEMLIAARAVQGAAAALLAPTSLALLQDVDEPRARLRAVAAWSATSSVGGALGALLGGVLLLVWPWPAILLFEGGLALVGLLVALAVIPPRRPSAPARVDVVGALSLSLALAAAMVALVDAGTVGFSGPAFWIAVTVALVGAVAFALRHRAAPASSVLAPAVLGTPRVAAANVVMLLAAASCFPLWFLLSLTLQRVQGRGAFETGLWFLIPSAAVVLGSLAVPALRRRIATLTVVLLAGALTSAGALALAFSGGREMATAILPASAVALGMGLMFTTLTATGTRDLPVAYRGAAAGAVNASRQVGGATGLALATIAFANTGGVALGFAVLAASGVLVLLVAPLLHRPLREEPPVEQPDPGGPVSASGSRGQGRRAQRQGTQG